MEAFQTFNQGQCFHPSRQTQTRNLLKTCGQKFCSQNDFTCFGAGIGTRNDLAGVYKLYQFITDLTDIMDPFELDKEFQINSNQEDGYYHEYCRLLLANIALTSQMKEIIEEKNELIARLRKYEDQEFNSQSQRINDKIKRMRRNADEIERYYKCCVKVCGKSYGSEGSLNQHYKLKHPEIYVSLPNVKEEADQNTRDKENRHKNGNNSKQK